MRVVAAEAGDDHLRRAVGDVVMISIGIKQNIGRVRDPDAAVSDRNARGDVQSIGKDLHLIDGPVAVGVFENLDAILPRSQCLARVLDAFGHPHPAALVERHRHRVH